MQNEREKSKNVRQRNNFYILHFHFVRQLAD